MLSGDFNIIASPSESFIVNQGVSNDIKEFTEAMIKLSIFDHAYTGPMLTWSNRHLEGFIVRKLDRILVNDNWCLLFT